MGSFNDLINQIRNWPNTKPVPMTYDERSSTGIWAILGLLTNDFQNGTISGAFSKTQQQLSVAIVTGIVTGKDGIALDPFAGCVIDAIFVTTGSGNWIDVTQAAGYLGVGVNDNDNMMLSPNFIAEHNDSRFNPNYSLTGVGSSAQWPTGTYTGNAIVLYTNSVGITQQPSMIQFTTTSEQNTYNLGSALVGFKPAYLQYGGANLVYSGGSGAPGLGEFSINDYNIIINPGGSIDVGIKCTLVSL